MSTSAPQTRLRGHSGATAARRGLLVSAVLIAALVAHAVASGGLSIIPIAPAIWIMLVVCAALAGLGGTRVFRPRGALVTLAVLLGGQAVLHLGLTYAPWAFGLNIHHEAALVPGLAPIAAHVVAAVVLALVIARAERVLAAAIRIVRALVATPAPRRRRSGAPPSLVADLVVRVPAHGLRRALPRRGPPLPA